MIPQIIIAIVTAIIILIILLLCVRIRIQLMGQEDFTVLLRILFFRYTFYPRPETPRHAVKEDKKERKKQKKKEKKATNAVQTESTDSETTDEHVTEKKKKKKDVLHIIRLVTYMLIRLYKYFPRYLKLRLRRVIVIIGGPDASGAAIRYGAARAGIAYLLEVCETFSKIKTPRNAKLLVEPNFQSNDSSCDIDIDLSISVFSSIILLIRAFPVYLAGEKELKNKKLRKSAKKETSTVDAPANETEN